MQAGQLPLDLWGLDMNWRNTSSGQERYYDHPNTALFPDWKEWLGFLRAKGLRTYFNDHPFPVASRDAGGLQTSKEEVSPPPPRRSVCAACAQRVQCRAMPCNAVHGQRPHRWRAGPQSSVYV